MTARPTSSVDWGGTQIEPSAGQKSAGFAPGDRPPAQWINWLLSNLQEWIEYLDTEKLRDVAMLASDVPIVGTEDTANEHPASGSNVWKLFLRARVTEGTYARMYVGDGPNGSWAITTNAVWNPAAGSQNWSKDDTGQESSILLVGNNTLTWLGRAAGAGTWTVWTTTLGSVVVGGALNVSGISTLLSDLWVTGDVNATGGVVATTGNVEAAAGDVLATLGDVRALAGDVFAQGSVTGFVDVIATSGDVSAIAGDVVAGQEFLYGAPVLRTTIVPIASVYGQALREYPGSPEQEGSVSIPSGIAPFGIIAAWPLILPHGATLEFVDVQINVHDAANLPALKVQSRFQADWAALPAPPVITTVVAGAPPAVVALHTVSLNCGSSLMSTLVDELQLVFTQGAGVLAVLDSVESIRMRWYDPGPRNF